MTMKSHSKLVETFMPYTLEERLLKMHERLKQAWPNFGRSGLIDFWPELNLINHHPGTVVRFFVNDDLLTFTGLAAVKHGAHWHLSEEVDAGFGGVSKLTSVQMKAYLKAHNLNWVVVL